MLKIGDVMRCAPRGAELREGLRIRSGMQVRARRLALATIVASGLLLPILAGAAMRDGNSGQAATAAAPTAPGGADAPVSPHVRARRERMGAQKTMRPSMPHVGAQNPHRSASKGQRK
jgi:hypothetical protein